MRAWRDGGRDIVLSNPAVNGYTTDDLIAEQLPHLRAFQPTFISVLIGANDIVRGSTEDRYRGKLERIHKAIKADAPGARVVALPQPDWSLSPAASGFGDPVVIARIIERFNAIAHHEAERAGASWLDLFPLMREQGRRGMFAPDGLHPSPEAYVEWAREIARSVWASSP